MFWQKKEEKNGLPDLPPLKNPPLLSNSFDEEDDEIDNEKHALPAFPDSPAIKGFSQSAIKEAVSPEKELPLPPTDKTFRTYEVEDWRTKQNQQIICPPTIPIVETERFVPKNRNDKNDVFIRIDKYFSARKSLETARLNLNEIEELLKKIRETRMREEQELQAWEKDMMSIKAKIKEISENIFEKLE